MEQEAIKANVKELRDVMGSRVYDKYTQHAAAVNAVILAAPEEARDGQASQVELVEFLIKNHGNGNIPTTDQFFPDVPVMSDERLMELHAKNNYLELLEKIRKDKLPIADAAKRIHGHLMSKDGADERDYFTAYVMFFTNFCPYNFWNDGTDVTKEEFDEAVEKNRETADKVTAALGEDGIRFYNKPEKWEYIFSQLDVLDEKAKWCVMGAAWNRYERMSTGGFGGLLESALGGLLGGTGIEIIIDGESISMGGLGDSEVSDEDMEKLLADDEIPETMKGFLTDPEFPSSLRDEVAKRLLDPEKRQEIKENCLRCDERETCDSVAKW